MKSRHVALLALVCLLAVPTFAADLAKAGRWETTAQMEMPGMPIKMPPQTFVTCLTEEQAKNAENLVPKSGDKRGGCTYTDVKVEGSTVSWKMNCEKQGMTGAGTITYSGDSYDGSVQMKMGDRDMSMKYTGKYKGACDGTEMNAEKKK
jgi:hypothetical protein